MPHSAELNDHRAIGAATKLAECGLVPADIWAYAYRTGDVPLLKYASDLLATEERVKEAALRERIMDTLASGAAKGIEGIVDTGLPDAFLEGGGAKGIAKFVGDKAGDLAGSIVHGARRATNRHADLAREAGDSTEAAFKQRAMDAAGNPKGRVEQGKDWMRERLDPQGRKITELEQESAQRQRHADKWQVDLDARGAEQAADSARMDAYSGVGDHYIANADRVRDAATVGLGAAGLGAAGNYATSDAELSSNRLRSMAGLDTYSNLDHALGLDAGTL